MRVFYWKRTLCEYSKDRSAVVGTADQDELYPRTSVPPVDVGTAPRPGIGLTAGSLLAERARPPAQTKVFFRKCRNRTAGTTFEF